MVANERKRLMEYYGEAEVKLYEDREDKNLMEKTLDKRNQWHKYLYDSFSLACLMSLMDENESSYVSISLITWYTC